MTYNAGEMVLPQKRLIFEYIMLYEFPALLEEKKACMGMVAKLTEEDGSNYEFESMVAGDGEHPESKITGKKCNKTSCSKYAIITKNDHSFYLVSMMTSLYCCRQQDEIRWTTSSSNSL